MENNDNQQSGVEVLATTFVKTFLWLISIVISFVALLIYGGGSKLAALMMLCSAILINPLFVEYAINTAIEQGKRQPSSVVFVLSSFGLAVFSVYILISA